MISTADIMFNNFKLYCPNYVDRVKKYSDIGYYQLKVELDDGSIIIYDELLPGIKFPASNPNELTEQRHKSEFGYNLRRMMRLKGINQIQLAEFSGVSKYSINHYINGKASPSLYNAGRIADALDCSISDLDPNYKHG